MLKRSILSGRFGALTGISGDLMKNLETPGKTGRVGRYGSIKFKWKRDILFIYLFIYLLFPQ